MSESVSMDDIFAAFQAIAKQEFKPDTILMYPTSYQQSVNDTIIEYTYTLPISLKYINITFSLDDAIHERRRAEPVGTQLTFNFIKD